MRRYTKAIFAALGAISTWGATASLDGQFTEAEFWGLAAALITVLGVYQFPNVSPGPIGDPGISETDGHI